MALAVPVFCILVDMGKCMIYYEIKLQIKGEKMLRKLKKKLHPENMMFKMIVLNCGLLLLVALVLTAAGNYIYQGSIEERSYANTMEIQNQVLKSLDQIFQSVSDNVEILGDYPEVQGYLNVDAENQQASRVNLEGQVRNLLLNYSHIYKEYLNIVVVSEKGQYLSNDSYCIKKLPLTDEKWYQEAVRADGKLVLCPSSLGRNLKDWKNYSTDSYVSTAKMIKDLKTGQGIGVILIDLDLNSIQNLVEDITMGQTGFGYIQDSQGYVLYAPKNKVVYRMNPAWVMAGESGRVRCRIEGKDYNVIYSHSEYTDLTAVGVFDWGKTIEGAARVRTVSWWIAAVIIVFAAGITVVFSASFTRPISALSRLMKKAQTGDMNVRFENHYTGEIRQLGDSFNAMVEKINELLEVVYREQKNKREAELKILHEQIKPHFLYNTLDTIQWMAKEYHAQDIVDLVLALSGFFRISLSQGKEFITLEQEVLMVRNYLEIQKVRYEDLFNYSTEIEEGMENYMVLKICLQPLVENALYHGIKESDEDGGNIWIRAFSDENDDIILNVEDNGAGMSQEKIDQLNFWLRLKERGAEIKAYGILNVNDRIKIAYGDEYGLHYEKRTGGGTVAVVRLKRLQKEEICGKF